MVAAVTDVIVHVMFNTEEQVKISSREEGGTREDFDFIEDPVDTNNDEEGAWDVREFSWLEFEHDCICIRGQVTGPMLQQITTLRRKFTRTGSQKSRA